MLSSENVEQAQGVRLGSFPNEQNAGFRSISGWPAQGNAGVDQTVKSAARVMEIFELFCYRKEALSVGEVAAELGYPQSSTSVLMQSLHRMGYLIFDAKTRLYQPSIRLPMLGGWVQDRVAPGVPVLEMMHEILQRTGETVFMGHQCGCYIRYVEVLPGCTDPSIRNGTTCPIARSALGRVLLSKKRDDEVRLLLRTMNASLEDPDQRMDECELLEDLRETRLRAYARTSCTDGRGRGAYAIEMPTAVTSPPLAIGIGGVLQRLDANREGILSVLREVVSRCRAGGAGVTTA